MINRTLLSQIQAQTDHHKAVIIMGARQVGKSTLLQQVLGNRDDVLWMNGDESDIQALFSQMTSTRLKAIIGNKKIVVIDEAQRIADIGLRMKLIVDQIPDVQLFATGSSSFELAAHVNEPLTGRKREMCLYPLTFREMVQHTSLLEELRMIPHRLIYGYYPEVVLHPGEEKEILKELTNSYLYRDILAMDKITKSEKLVHLLKALSFQIGSQVSYHEIGQLIGLDPKTVERYIDILEKSFVIFRLPCFARNLRNEIKLSRKIYFWDLGIRNAVIGNLSAIENRQDVGMLWENYIIVERLKQNAYSQSWASTYFWRTKNQQEIDYIEEENGHISAYEFKWNDKKGSAKCPSSFINTYPNVSFQVITPANVDTFI